MLTSTVVLGIVFVRRKRYAFHATANYNFTLFQVSKKRTRSITILFAPKIKNCYIHPLLFCFCLWLSLSIYTKRYLSKLKIENSLLRDRTTYSCNSIPISAENPYFLFRIKEALKLIMSIFTRQVEIFGKLSLWKGLKASGQQPLLWNPNPRTLSSPKSVRHVFCKNRGTSNASIR